MPSDGCAGVLLISKFLWAVSPNTFKLKLLSQKHLHMARHESIQFDYIFLESESEKDLLPLSSTYKEFALFVMLN